jgi:DNA helicase-2/ATP-dependent DNA helicase PcrA
MKTEKAPGLLSLEDLKAALNPHQLEAATYGSGPLLVLAGAGSGKTRTLVYRVAWLISQGADPSGVLLLTFTRKAAEEMLGRCRGLIGGVAGGVEGGTFHSVALRRLREEHAVAGYPKDFEILDKDESERFLKSVMDDMKEDF